MYVSHKTAHVASDNFSFHFYMKEFNNCHEICSKACATAQDFSIENTAFTLMSGDVSAVERICNFYLGITWTIESNRVRKDIYLINWSQS